LAGIAAASPTAGDLTLIAAQEAARSHAGSLVAERIA
jgi:hypothetical protein